MGTCCSAGSRICQLFDPCQGVSWTVRGQEASASLLSNPSLLAATFLIRVRNLAETRSGVTTAWPGQNHEKITGETAPLAVSATLWLLSLAPPELSNVLGWRDSSDTRPLRWSLLAPVSIISGTILFTDFSQGTIQLTFYPRSSCLWDKENGNWISALPSLPLPRNRTVNWKFEWEMRPEEISIQNIQFLFVLYDNINSLLATLFL